jgi:hypothetical protein
VKPRPGEVLHFSEDPTITRFEPHVAPTSADQNNAYVWACDEFSALSFWFPRQCPRAMAWIVDTTSPDDAERILGPGGGTRVHAIEYHWLPALTTTRLYAYRFSRETFRLVDDPARYLVSTEAVEPLGPPEPVGDLIERHAEAGIQLRVLPSLRQFWDAVVESTLGFSGVRLRNARGMGG